MKIAIHQPRISHYVGGGERVPLEHAKYFSELGHEVVIVTSDVKDKPFLFLDFIKNYPSVKVEALELSTKLKEIYKKEAEHSRRRFDRESLEFGRIAKKYYAKNKFDVVAIHYTVDAVMIPNNQKIILHLHGCPAQKRKIDENSIKKADTLVAVSRYVADFWKEMYKIKAPVRLAYNGINSENFRPKDMGKQVDILYVGRLIQIKGVSDLIKSIPIINRHITKKPKIAIVGKGPEKEKLVNLAKKLNVVSQITWMDSVSDKKLIEMYNKSRVCVFPSIAKEGVLTTMLEAASCGAAIITANCCSMPEFITSGKNGLLVEPNSPEDIALASVRLLNDSKLAKSLGDSAQSSIHRSWSWKKRIKELEKIYKNA